MKLTWPAAFPGVHYLDAQEQQAALDVLQSCSPFRYYGPRKPRHVEAFEAAARQFYGSTHALAVNSGTGALMTVMTALAIGPGDEVIVPAFLWVSTVGAVVFANAIPVLCEIDDTFGIDPEDLKKKITPRTKLIIAVHMAGSPCGMEPIISIARQRGIPVLEDCAQCNGGSLFGKSVGTFGRAGIFSFQINKNCTAGEGGLVVTDDPDLYHRLNAAHDVGVPWSEGTAQANSPHLAWGQGRRMSELIGAVACVQMGKLPRIIRAMRASKKSIKHMLAGIPGLSFRRIIDDAGDTGCALIFLLPDARKATSAVKSMREAGLGGTRLADYGMHIYCNTPQLVAKVPLSPAGNPWGLPQNASSVYNYAKGACPRSDELFAKSIILAIPSCLNQEQEEQAAMVIREAIM